MERMVLRLYVAGDGPNSAAARSNLRRLLAGCDPETYTLEVVDCLRQPMRALQEGVLVTPTLLRVAPAPVRTIVGSLSDGPRVLEALGLPDTTQVVPQDV
jgi:circadian clock protein KaiB